MPETKTVELNGLRFNLNFWGKPSGRPLLLVHGFMDVGASFAALADDLGDDFHCVAPDLRGFGDTDPTPNGVGYFFYEYVPDLHGIIEAVWPGEAIAILGHSMGGNIASMYAGTFSERVSHLVNVDGFGIADMPPEDGPGRMRAWVEQTQRGLPPSRPVSRSALIKKISMRYPTMTEQQIDRWISQLAGSSAPEVVLKNDPRHRWTHPYPFRVDGAAAFWRRIEAKLLLVVSGALLPDDGGQGIAPPSAIRDRLSCFPEGATTVRMPKVGHMVHLEDPAGLAAEVRAFID